MIPALVAYNVDADGLIAFVHGVDMEDYMTRWQGFNRFGFISDYLVFFGRPSLDRGSSPPELLPNYDGHPPDRPLMEDRLV